MDTEVEGDSTQTRQGSVQDRDSSTDALGVLGKIWTLDERLRHVRERA